MDKAAAAPLRVGQADSPGLGLGAHKGRGSRRPFRIVRLLLAGAALVFLAREIILRWPQLWSLHLNPWWLGAAVLFFGAGLCGQVAAWQWNLRRLGARVSYRPLFRVYFITNL